MQFLARCIFSTCLVLAPVTANSGVESFPISEFMDMVDEETHTKRSTLTNQSASTPAVRSSANKTENPTKVESPMMVPVEPSKVGTQTPQSSNNDQSAPKKQRSFIEGTMTVGAREFALAAECEFMQVYRAATDADFSATLDLIRYRASSMGAEYLTIIFHQEGVSKSLAESFFDSVYLFQTGNIQPTIQTVMVAEMYDCHG